MAATTKAVAVMRTLLLALIILATCALLRASLNSEDFLAFRCVAKLAVAGQPVYENAALNACEFQDEYPVVRKYLAERTIPVPLPGYSIAFFVPVAGAPWAAAKAVAIATIAVCYALAVWMVRRLTQLPLQLVVAASIYPLFYSPEHLGELSTLVFAGFATCLYFSQRQVAWAAAACAAATLLQPHLGLPIFLGLALLWPATRGWLAGFAAALAAVSLATIGPSQNLEYFLRVLPAHARADLARDAQFSLSSFLYTLGAPIPLALKAGSLSYIVMLGLSLWCVYYLNRRTKSREFSLAFAPVFVLIGGTYLHAPQFALSSMAAFMLLARSQDPSIQHPRWLLPLTNLCVIFLAAPLFLTVNRFEASIAVCIVFIVSLELIAYEKLALPRPYLLALAATMAQAWCCRAYVHAVHAVDETLPQIARVMLLLRNSVQPHMLADDIWRIYVDASEHRLGVSALFYKSTLWIAVLLLAGMGLALTRSAIVLPETGEGSPSAAVE